MTLTLIAAAEVPVRTVSATAKSKLAEFRAAEAVKRAAEAAPLVAGLLAGSGLKDGTPYPDRTKASNAANAAKRLVDPGLAAGGKRAVIRVEASADGTFAWFITVANAKPPKAPATTDTATV